jgi:hypothetical protein
MGGFDVVHTGPPFNSPAWKETATDSHDASKFAPKAIVGRKLMYLCLQVSTTLN